MLPVWIATYRFENKVFRLLVNGQTGEVVGETPTVWWKIALAGLVGLLIAAAVLVCIHYQAGAL